MTGSVSAMRCATSLTAVPAAPGFMRHFAQSCRCYKIASPALPGLIPAAMICAVAIGPEWGVVGVS